MKLLEPNHPTVLRRLVRELNSQQAGFYTNGHRYNRARLHKGQLQVRMTCMDRWESMGFENYFSDGMGKQICASRHPKYN